MPVFRLVVDLTVLLLTLYLLLDSCVDPQIKDAIAKLSFLGMLKEQSLPLLIPASVQRTAVPHLVLEIRRQELIEDTLAQVNILFSLQSSPRLLFMTMTCPRYRLD